MGAYVLIGLVSVSIAMQLLFAIVQNKHLGRHAVAWEVFPVLSLAKPGVDAIRFASGAEHVTGAPFSPWFELMLGKALEIAFEAGPGAALQAYIVLHGYVDTSAVVSVGISCLSIGFTTAMMAFEADTSPFYRKMEPNFYGYIPDDRQ
jgi:hypothetical protein